MRTQRMIERKAPNRLSIVISLGQTSNKPVKMSVRPSVRPSVRANTAQSARCHDLQNPTTPAPQGRRPWHWHVYSMAQGTQPQDTSQNLAILRMRHAATPTTVRCRKIFKNPKGPFIATQLNSTPRRVELSWVASLYTDLKAPTLLGRRRRHLAWVWRHKFKKSRILLWASLTTLPRPRGVKTQDFQNPIQLRHRFGTYIHSGDTNSTKQNFRIFRISAAPPTT